MNYTRHQIAALLNGVDPTQVMVGADFNDHDVVSFNRLANSIVLDAAFELRDYMTQSYAHCAHDAEDIAYYAGLEVAVDILTEIAT